MSLDKELLQDVKSGAKTPAEALEAMRAEVKEFNGSVDPSFVAALMDLGLESVIVEDEAEVGEEVFEDEVGVDLSGAEPQEAPLTIDEAYVEDHVGEETYPDEPDAISY